MTAHPNSCVTCGHHKRDHGILPAPGESQASSLQGCRRCDELSDHRFLSPQAADSMLAEHPDLLPAATRLQAKYFALEQAHRTYDLVTEALDDPPSYDQIIEWAKIYADFLLS